MPTWSKSLWSTHIKICQGFFLEKCLDRPPEKCARIGARIGSTSGESVFNQAVPYSLCVLLAHQSSTEEKQMTRWKELLSYLRDDPAITSDL
jgi:hypothetical protein